jgi:hypothetical protein
MTFFVNLNEAPSQRLHFLIYQFGRITLISQGLTGKGVIWQILLVLGRINAIHEAWVGYPVPNIDGSEAASLQ